MNDSDANKNSKGDKINKIIIFCLTVILIITFGGCGKNDNDTKCEIIPDKKIKIYSFYKLSVSYSIGRIRSYIKGI